jgi:hypothetical protein
MKCSSPISHSTFPQSQVIPATKSKYTSATSIESWLIDFKLQRYVPYFRDTLGVIILEDLLPFAKVDLTKEQLIQEWEDFDFKNSVSPIYQGIIVRELRNLAALE